MCAFYGLAAILGDMSNVSDTSSRVGELEGLVRE